MGALIPREPWVCISETGAHTIPVRKGIMTDEFRLVLCEPVVRAKVAKAKRAKAKLLNRWQGPLEPCPRPEWDRWYHQQRGVKVSLKTLTQKRAELFAMA